MVYWYRLPTHTNPHLEGYVGVTVQSQIRHRCHKNGISGGSKILSQAFRKYGEESIIKDVLHIVDSKEEAYELEHAYRPRPFTGWNLAIGGGLPPSNIGRKDSIDTRKKRADSVRAAKAGKSYPSQFKGMVGRFTDEQLQAIGAVHRGKTISKAHRLAITEKISGENNAKAKEVFLAHVDVPQKVHHYACIKSAATALNIPYNTLRSVVQRTLKLNRTSEPSRTGWVCLSRQDAQNSVNAIALSISTRNARFRQMAQEREANRKAQGTGVAPSINR